ncbi:MAG: methionyl-tRNA formyltransferase [Thiotrichaceae bacterium]|nr:methionyl-tRNA formyltransferase [Thiotrichaceae bacterium]
MAKKRIVFAGTPEFSVSCLSALLNSSHEICAVYTQPDRPAGRGRKLTASPVKQLAVAHNIPVYQPQTLKTPEAQAELRALAPDMLIVVAYGLLLPKAVLEIPKLGCVNVHASLLPRWRGAAPIQRSLLAGDTETGITLMQMDVGLDTGAMLKKVHCEILPNDTAETLHDRLAQLGADLLAANIDDLENLPATAQHDDLATYAQKLNKVEAQLDWQQNAAYLARQVRAFNPYPIAQAEIAGETFRIWAAEALAEAATVAAGQIQAVSRAGIDIATGEGVLRVLSLQQAGGKAIAVRDFLNSRPQFGRGA